MQQPPPGTQPLQRPPHPGQGQPRPPMGFRPQQPNAGAATGFRPPMQPGLPRPGFQSPNGAVPPPHPGLPATAGVRPGFPPNQPRPMMRPVIQSPTQSPASRPIVAGGSPATVHSVPSPVQHQQESPMSPTHQHSTAEHHRRKRMYPEQITKAYSGDVPVSPGYPPQQQQQYGSPGMANQQIQQQSQFISPMGTPATAPAAYAQPIQQQQQQPQQQQTRQPAYVQPGYNAFIQDPVNQMSSQFGNMNMGGAAPVSIVLKWD